MASRSTMGKTNFQAFAQLLKQTAKYFYVLFLDASQCTKDKLLVSDGNFTSPICGSRSQYNHTSKLYTFKNGDVSFHFTNDATGSGRGFLTTYKLIDGQW